MKFRDLNIQYSKLKKEIDEAVFGVLEAADYISGSQVKELEAKLEAYVGVKHCITCGNGTDALTLALKVWDMKEGDAVFVPSFTFFASGEAVALEGAAPIFVDVEEDTFNMSPESLEAAVQAVLKEKKLIPKVILAVDLFGQPANYNEIKKIAEKYNLFILEDGAQGFGGAIGGKKACSFGDISTTSFFPAKPLGCYGDGGAVFTNNDIWAEKLRSLSVHGKGEDKYDNIRIGMNSRLDTVQAAVLLVKLKAFQQFELEAVNKIAETYHQELEGIVKTPVVLENYYSSWAQYTIVLDSKEQRNNLKNYLSDKEIPSMIYYQKPLHKQKAFSIDCRKVDLPVSEGLCEKVLSLPMHPYMNTEHVKSVAACVKEFLNQ